MNRYALFTLLAASLIVTAGCARRDGVVIDPEGVDMAQYRYDLSQCREIAKQVETKAPGRAVGGAVIGGALGAIFGDAGAVKRGAGAGAVVGGARGAGATGRERQKVVKNCLRNRGYAVLN